MIYTQSRAVRVEKMMLFHYSEDEVKRLLEMDHDEFAEWVRTRTKPGEHPKVCVITDEDIAEFNKKERTNYAPPGVRLLSPAEHEAILQKYRGMAAIRLAEHEKSKREYIHRQAMTVAQLIEALSKLNPDTPVCFDDDGSDSPVAEILKREHWVTLGS